MKDNLPGDPRAFALDPRPAPAAHLISFVAAVKGEIHSVKGVGPDTVVGWQRQGFRLFWGLISRAKRVGRPRISRELRELISRMARENDWGAPRIHGELLKLGFRVDERTVSRYLPRGRTPPDQLQRWSFCAVAPVSLNAAKASWLWMWRSVPLPARTSWRRHSPRS